MVYHSILNTVQCYTVGPCLRQKFLSDYNQCEAKKKKDLKIQYRTRNYIGETLAI